MLKRNLKTSGIILRKTDYAEADRIFVILTKELGKISAIAKGVRKIKSKMGGHLEFFSEINFEFYKSDSSELYLINGAENLSVSKKIIQDLSLMEEGYKIIRLINEFTEEKYPLPKILQLSNESFKLLNQAESTDLILCAFQIKFFTILGYLPSFDHCLKCEEKLKDTQNYFELGNLGILCEKCLSAVSIVQKITFPMIKTLNFLQKNELNNILKIKLETKDLTILKNLTEKIIQSIRER